MAKRRGKRKTRRRTWEVKRPRRRMFYSHRDGSIDVVRRGEIRWSGSDIYHWFLTIPIFAGILVCGCAYLFLNAIFALIYMADPGGVHGVRPGNFADAFFFSIQTIATIGYGVMYPQSMFAHIVVTIESVTGILTFALITGLLFTRFSRPTARVMFSHVAVIAPLDGVPTLMFRMANERRNQILQAEVRATLVRDEVTKEESEIRRLHELKLLRSQSSFFGLTWTVMHPIDEASPLRNETERSLIDSEAEIVILLAGIEEALSQQVHVRHSYSAEEIFWHHRFADILTRLPDGRRLIDLRRFHETLPIKHGAEAHARETE